MKNQKLIQRIDTFYHLASSMPIKKMAEADEFDSAADAIKPKQPQVLCKNGHEVSSSLPKGPAKVSQFMVVSTKADKPDSFGLIPDDALVFIFLDEDHYMYPQQYPDDNTKLVLASAYAKSVGINADGKKYFSSLVGKSKVRDKKDAENHCYSHCVAIFKVE